MHQVSIKFPLNKCEDHTFIRYFPLNPGDLVTLTLNQGIQSVSCRVGLSMDLLQAQLYRPLGLA